MFSLVNGVGNRCLPVFQENASTLTALKRDLRYALSGL
jgi:hypothetical protein